MLEIFRKNYFVTSILLLPYLFIVRIGLFKHNRVLDFADQSSLTNTFIYPWITNNYIEIITTNLIIFIQALIVNYMFLNHKLARNSSLLAGLFYIVFVSMIYSNTHLSDAIIANTFLIISLRNLWKSYKQPSISFRIFNIGFLMGLSAIIYPPYFVLLLFALTAMFIIKSVRLLDMIQFALSFTIPFFLYFCYSYIAGKVFQPFSFLQTYQFDWDGYVLKNDLIIYLALGLTLSSMIFSLLWYNDIMKRKNIEAQKKIDTLYWLSFFILITFIVFPQYNIEHLIILSIPLSLFFGIKVGDSKNKLAFELLHLLFLGVIIVSQFQLL